MDKTKLWFPGMHTLIIKLQKEKCKKVISIKVRIVVFNKGKERARTELGHMDGACELDGKILFHYLGDCFSAGCFNKLL